MLNNTLNNGGIALDKERLSIQRDVLVNMLTSELPVLRAKLGISQEDISMRIGISRQTYSLIESKKQKMTWVTFMALLAFFENNEGTKKLLTSIGFFKNSAFTECLIYK